MEVNGVEHVDAAPSKWKKGVKFSMFLWHGDTLWDAWLLAAAAQCGQTVLTLPYSLAQMGIAYAVVFLVLNATMGAWSVFLLTWLYLEYKARLVKEGKELPKGHILQYHDVIRETSGTWAGRFTWFFVMITFVTASIIQLIGSSSNLYYVNDSWTKRDWAFLTGGISFLSIFIPNFGHFRAGAFLGISSTCIAALYLFIVSVTNGEVEHVTHTRPKDNVQFFTGVANTIFLFGGHGLTIEILESMKQPAKFKWIYAAVTAFTMVVMLPSSIAVYWRFGDILLKRSNAFSVLPHTGWRDLAAVMMVLHQFMVYVLFIFPLFLVIEKYFNLRSRSLFLRALIVRIPLVLVIWLIALLFPFFGPVNSVMGAFLVTTSAYAIPPLAFMYTYRSATARQNSVVPLPTLLRSWTLIFLINIIIVAWMLVVGMGFGGWASISNIVRQVDTFGFFSSCYQCPPKAH